MSNKKIIQAIGFTIDPPGQMARCLRFNDGGVRAATPQEKSLWDALHGTVVGDGQAGDTTPVSTELVNFLRGAGKLEGLEFGDKLEGHDAGELWWRDLLPAAEPVEIDPVESESAGETVSSAPNVTATSKNPGDLQVLTTAPAGDVDHQPALGSLQPQEVVDAAASGTIEQLLTDQEQAAQDAQQAAADGAGKSDSGVVTEAPTGDVDHKPALGAESADAPAAAAKPKAAAKSTSTKKA